MNELSTNNKQVINQWKVKKPEKTLEEMRSTDPWYYNGYMGIHGCPIVRNDGTPAAYASRYGNSRYWQGVRDRELEKTFEKTFKIDESILNPSGEDSFTFCLF